MLVGTKLSVPIDPAEFAQQINGIKELFGIREQRLETLLKNAVLS